MDYYIGEMQNDLRHGKGIVYDKNSNIIYEGDLLMINMKGMKSLFMKMEVII